MLLSKTGLFDSTNATIGMKLLVLLILPFASWVNAAVFDYVCTDTWRGSLFAPFSGPSTAEVQDASVYRSFGFSLEIVKLDGMALYDGWKPMSCKRKKDGASLVKCTSDDLTDVIALDINEQAFVKWMLIGDIETSGAVMERGKCVPFTSFKDK